MSDFLVKLFQNPSFLGALLGATITGGLALYINTFQNKKEIKKEINESQKVLMIFHHYSKAMITSFNSLNKNYNEYDSIYDPHSEIELYEDEYGNDHLVGYPQDFQIKEYKYEVDPLINRVKKESEFILGEFEKINSINIYSLKLNKLDHILKFLGTFKSTIEPKLREIIKSEYPSITSQELDVINRVFEGFNSLTKLK